MTRRAGAAELLATVTDPGSFRSWDRPPTIDHWPADYQRQLRTAREHSGHDESVATGTATVDGHPVALIVSEFGFLAGSIGAAAADRIVAAIRRATADRLPLLAFPASGGTRMQEGTAAFVRMLDIAAALAEHRAAGLPYVVYLRHPTTGGVLASWGSLGQVTFAEPEALVGFLGPRVYSALHGTDFPGDVQRSENLARRGIVDAVLPLTALRPTLATLLDVLLDPPTSPTSERPPAAQPTTPVWESVQVTRADDRVGLGDLLARTGPTVELSGTGAGERTDAVRVLLTRLGSGPCVLVGQDRRSGAPLGPAALRVAQRGMRLADELGLPLVTVVDTAGADLSVEAEEGALAGEIARTIALQRSLRVPTVAVLLGQGCGGGALALLGADTVIATENAWLSPLPPEGASAIVHHDTTHAAELAEQQRIGAADLARTGFVARVVAEPDGAPAIADAVLAELTHRLATTDLRHLATAGCPDRA